MADPTSLVQNHVMRRFPPREQDEVRRLLQEDCGAALAWPDNAPPEFSKRVQCAALKLSDGRMDKIYHAIALARTDRRDLLVCAGFAEHTQAHKDW